MSRRTHTGPSTGAAEDEVLKETRKLLNALNDENAELKSQNNALSDKLRRSCDAVAALTEEKDALERDMKQINFNLMQQLKAKSLQSKEGDAEVARLHDRIHSLERHIQSVSSSLEEVESSRKLYQERVALLEEQNRLLQSKLQEACTSADAAKARADAADDGQRKMREALVSLQSECAAERISAQTLVAEERAKLTQRDDELKALQESMSRQVGSLTIDAQRTAVAEAELLFAHNQMVNTSSMILDELCDAQQKVRGALSQVAETDLSLGEQVERIRTLSHSLALFGQHDSQLIEYSMAQLRQQETEISALTKALEVQKQLSMDRETNTVQCDAEAKRLTAQVAELVSASIAGEATKQRLEQEVESMRKQIDEANRSHTRAAERAEQMSRALLEADAALSVSADSNRRLEADLAAEKSRRAAQIHEHRTLMEKAQEAFAAERLRWQDEITALEDENESLHLQLREYTETLAGALSRLAAAHTPVGGRRSLSSTHRSMSTDSALGGAGHTKGSTSFARDQGPSEPSRGAPPPPTIGSAGVSGAVSMHDAMIRSAAAAIRSERDAEALRREGVPATTT